MTTHGSVIPAACALFVEHRRETVYLTAGALPEYRAYQAPALLVHEGMLRLCVNSTQPRRFNMYGITGVFNDPDDEGRGVLEFKQGFNGQSCQVGRQLRVTGLVCFIKSFMNRESQHRYVRKGLAVRFR